MIEAAVLALRDILSKPFRGVLVKSLLLTLALLAAVWAALAWLLAGFVTLPYPWLDQGFSILAAVALVVAMAFLIAPVTALFAGIFLDDIAEVVERTHYPGDRPGEALPLGQSIMTGLRFLPLVIAVNAVALPLVLFVGFGFVIFLGANGFLLGREYFGLAASRFHDGRSVGALRARHSGRIFAAGLVIAGFLAVPFLNLLGPLFATAFMVHLHKQDRNGGRAAGLTLNGPVGRGRPRYGRP
jgi:CysZ protein